MKSNKDKKNDAMNGDADEIEIVDEAETQTEVEADADAKASAPAAGTTTADEIAELKKQNLYLLADFDNYRKQAIKERSDLVKYGNEPVLREFLGVLDNLERAAAVPVTPETLENYKNGVEMIVSQFKKSLERFGVEEVDSQGQLFDPSIHEALGSDQNPNFPPNTVTQVLKKAFKLRGKIIRPAQVLVNTANNNSSSN